MRILNSQAQQRKHDRLRRLGILGSSQGAYVRELLAAARRYDAGLNVQLLSFADLAVTLEQGQVAVSSRTIEPCAIDRENISSDEHVPLELDAQQEVDLLALDGLIVRTMPLGSLEQVIFRMDALQAVENAGVPVLNPPRTLEVAIDKWLTLERLSRAGIATPPTIACQSRARAMEAFERVGGDVVIKPLFGGDGRGMIRLAMQIWLGACWAPCNSWET